MHVKLALAALSLSLASVLRGENLNAKQELAAGLTAAEFYNWNEAATHFRAAELRLPAADTSKKLLAKVGYMRSTMEQRNLAELTRQYQALSLSQAVRSDANLRLWLYIAKGDCDNDLQFPEAARRDWRIVEETAVLTKNAKWKYRAKGELAIPEYYLGDLASSRKLVTEALQAASTTNDNASVVRLLTHIGTVYMLRGDFAQGMSHLNEAEQIAGKTPESGFPVNVKEGQLLGLIGTNKLDEATRVANDIITRMHAQDRRINESQTRVMLAGIYEKQKNLKAAIDQLKIAIDISEKGNYYHSLSEAQMALAKIYLLIGKLSDASLWVARSLDATTKSGAVAELPAHLQLLAQLQQQEGRYTDADATYRRAENEVDAQLALTPSSSKQLLLKSTSAIYTNHFALLASHLHNVKSDYAVVERIRGRMLTDLLTSGSFSERSGDDSAEQEVSALRLRLASATTAEDVASAREAIFFARHKRWLDKEAFSPRSLKNNAGAVLPLAAVQQNLRPTELLLEYVVTSKSAYVLALDRDSARVADLGSTDAVNTAINQFVGAVRAKEEALTEGAALYDLLFKSIPEVANHSDLIVIPDGLLHGVPFAALVSSGKRLVESHSIVRAPSANSYVLLRRRSSKNGQDGLLAVGGVRYSADVAQTASVRGYGDHLSNLPGSEEEAAAATETLGPVLKNSVLLDGTLATETAVKSALKQQREVIHLAVHGVSHSKDDPELAALVFLPDKQAGQDGMLEIPEIVRLNLHSDLVVLSACETAVGELEGEEGISNLSRSFLLAGAESVTSTLWSVDDAFSATLMKHFYQELAKGAPKATALENSQRYVLSHFAGTAAPWYWAGYVMEGNATEPLANFGAKGGSGMRSPQ